jgi:hypothetical protein
MLASRTIDGWLGVDQLFVQASFRSFAWKLIRPTARPLIALAASSPMTVNVKLRKIGNSLGVILPKEVVDRWGYPKAMSCTSSLMMLTAFY